MVVTPTNGDRLPAGNISRREVTEKKNPWAQISMFHGSKMLCFVTSTVERVKGDMRQCTAHNWRWF